MTLRTLAPTATRGTFAADARAVSYDRIRAVLAALPDMGQGLKGQIREPGSKTAARLAVMAYTRLPHSLIKRLTPADIDWQGNALRAR